MRLLLASLLLFAAAVNAQQDYPRDITLSWTNADSYVDGSVIEAGDIESVRVECFRNNETVPTVLRTVPDSGEGQFQTETFVGVIPSPGTYTCVAYTVMFDATESDASNSVDRKYIGKPFPPQSFE